MGDFFFHLKFVPNDFSMIYMGKRSCFDLIPNNLKSDKLLKDRTVKIPNTHVPTPNILVAYMRDTENFSTTKVIAGSIREIEDVMAAKNNKILKRIK